LKKKRKKKKTLGVATTTPWGTATQWSQGVAETTPKRMWRMQLCPAILEPFRGDIAFLGWSWKLCSNSLVPFVVLGDFVGCRGLVIFWPRWFGVVNNGFGTYRFKINSYVLGRLPLGVAPPP
jgi:hypothetical protein